MTDSTTIDAKGIDVKDINANSIDDIVDLKQYPLGDLRGFVAQCKTRFDQAGSLLLPGFVLGDVVTELKKEALEHQHLAHYCQQTHTAFLSPVDTAFDEDHPRNRQVTSSKGCITDDQVPESSPLRRIYHNADFRRFLCIVLGETQLYEYADPLSSINVHYYEQGQELGWHFDNSSFAVTLMIQPSELGGEFEYIPNFRDAQAGDMNFEGVGRALDGAVEAKALSIGEGTLALFRGRNSLHRVTPVIGDTRRIQTVLAYNTEPGVALSEQARRTFYGRVQ